MKKLSIIAIITILFSLFGLNRVSQAEPLATIVVDTTIDSNAASYRVCSTAAGDCSLRGAISKSNAITGGIGLILVPAGTYTLTIAGADENYNASGDLDLLEGVTITGAGRETTTIQAGASLGTGIDRVIDIRNTGGLTQISDVKIRWGRLTCTSCGGAGINQDYNSGDVFISRVIVTENQETAYAVGAGLYTQADMYIFDAIITNNQTAGEGGGVYDSFGTLIVERTTLSGNSAVYGGALANQNDAILRNVTISGNSAVSGGGGISQWNSGNLTLYNTTVTNNTVTGGATSGWAISDLEMFTAYNSILTASGGNKACVTEMDAGDHNIASDSSCGTGATVADPLLGSLADNGGLTYTHAISPGSPAIDAGDNNSCMVRDQRGVLRRYDGDTNGSLICDVGAYEYDTGLILLNLFTPLIIKH